MMEGLTGRRPGDGVDPTARSRPGAIASRSLLISAVVLAVVAAVGLTPTEATMGHAQRVLYVHVSVAWLALVGYAVVAGTGFLYLLGRDLRWDRLSRATAELGWLCSSLTLATGSLWAHHAWDTWWTWDPRLITSFILWTIYGGYWILRGTLEDPHQRARAAAILAVIGVIDIPLVVMATRWFRGIHPVSPTMEPSMRLALLLTVAGLSAFVASLVACRYRQIRQEDLIRDLEGAEDPWGHPGETF